MSIKLVGGTFFLVLSDNIIPIDRIDYIEIEQDTITIYYNQTNTSLELLPGEKETFLRLFNDIPT